MNFDISQLLAEWEYQPGQVGVRKFVGKDGKEKIQLRIDLGVLQMNAQGRPDGKQPFGHGSYLEYYEACLKNNESEQDEDHSFSLDAEACAKLQQETLQYHHRYICLFQLEEFDAVLRDTEHNLATLNFAEVYAENDELAWSIQQFRPQLLLMRARAQGAKALKQDRYLDAIAFIQSGIEELETFYHEHAREDLLEQSSEIRMLKNWLEEIQQKRPLTHREKLQRALDDAVQREDYEKAAQYRDALRNLT